MANKNKIEKGTSKKEKETVHGITNHNTNDKKKVILGATKKI